MKIKVKDLGYKISQQYPYTYRVEVSADAIASDKVSAWLKETEIPHARGTNWGVFYMNKLGVECLLLRWS
jgi:hypothetical protein